MSKMSFSTSLYSNHEETATLLKPCEFVLSCMKYMQVRGNYYSKKRVKASVLNVVRTQFFNKPLTKC